MQKIELYTKLLEYVVTVEIPPFTSGPPDAVLWGTRYFKLLHPAGRGMQHEGVFYPERPIAYVECFVYASMTESPGLPRWEPPSKAEV
jgi:hypothetical protein